MEQQNVAAFVAIDLSAEIMINVLHGNFGVADVALQWFQSYLSQRSMKVIGKYHGIHH